MARSPLDALTTSETTRNDASRPPLPVRVSIRHGALRQAMVSLVSGADNSTESGKAALHSGYRREIDGLRAIAVLLVVAFHARVPGFGGGFVGVDVFFVISGYLIFGIILEALELRQFSFLGFYVRRVNRIFPALILVLLVTAALGWALLYSNELQSLGGHIAGGATFTSNFILWGESGYFDSLNKPLLHLWSLAVEEQFYLLFPIIAFTAWKRGWDIRWTLIALIEISFAVNVWQVRHGDGQAAFYLPAARFWEILTGALLFHLTQRSQFSFERGSRLQTVARESAPLIGLLMLGATVVSVTSATPWPGIFGVVPVLGAALIIAAGKESLINRMALGNPVLVAVGIISYPLYLWHWPLLIIAAIVGEGALPATVRAAVVVASFILAVGTYRLVETKIRFGRHKTRSALLLIPCLASAGVIGAFFFEGMLPSRLDAAAGRRKAAWGLDWEAPDDNFIADRKSIPLYRIPGDTTKTVLLFGDSHAQQYWPRFLELAEGKRPGSPEVDLIAFGGCPTLEGVNRFGIAWDKQPWQCDRIFQAAFTYAASPRVKTVILASYWEHYLTDGPTYAVGDSNRRPLAPNDPHTREAFNLLETRVRNLIHAGKVVYIVLSNPKGVPTSSSGMPKRFAGLGGTRLDQSEVRRADFLAATSYTTSRLREIASNTGAVVIDPADFLCNAVVCPRVAADGMPIYKDADHLRAGFVRKHVAFLDRALEQR